MPKLLLTNEVIATERWKMLETNPAYSEDLTSLQTAGKSAVCTYFRVLPGVTNTTTGDFPDISLAKSAWRSDILNGDFAAGTWTFKVRFESTTKYGFSIKVACRLSRSTNADGSSATLIGTYESPNTIAIPASAGGSISDSWTASLAALTLTNEYLFAEYRIHIEVAGSGATAQCAFACDEDPAVADESVETAAFTPGTQTFYQSISATSTGVSGLTKLNSFYRSLGVTAAALPVVSKGMYQTINATAIGQAVLTTANMFSKALDAVAQGVASLAKVTTYKQTLAAVAAGTSSLTKTATHYIILAASATGIPQLIKGMSKVLAATASGVPGLTSAYTALRTLAATAIGTSELTTQFISGSIIKLFRKVRYRGYWREES